MATRPKNPLINGIDPAKWAKVKNCLLVTTGWRRYEVCCLAQVSTTHILLSLLRQKSQPTCDCAGLTRENRVSAGYQGGESV
ncbi:hypothetical protein J6590_048043 [Homalodisca vitripennis]|nr:hypothetical protein J6590_048043 [Homalodisca vitripennis]